MARPASVYEFGSFLLDAPERRLMCRGIEISLPLKVFETLCLLVENAGHLMTKEDLLQRLWPDTVVQENSLNKNVSVLRKVLGESATGQAFIETVPRVGYRFVAPSMRSPRKCRQPTGLGIPLRRALARRSASV